MRGLGERVPQVDFRQHRNVVSEYAGCRGPNFGSPKCLILPSESFEAFEAPP